MRCCCSSFAVYADCATAPINWRDCAAQVDVSGTGVFGDLFPRRGLDLLGGGAAIVGQLEKLLAAFAFACDQQTFVDQQLQGRIHRSGAGAPQVLTALGDLLDHLVAVHRPLGEQLEDRGADIAATATPAAASVSATTTATLAGAESEAGGGPGVEAELEATAGAEAGGAVEAGVVIPDVIANVLAEVAPGLTPLLMQGATVNGAESETARWRSEWVGHGCFLTCVRKRHVRFRYVDDISETIAMQLLDRRGGRALVSRPPRRERAGAQ